MAGRAAVTAPGHPAQGDTARQGHVCGLGHGAGWAGSSGMLRSSCRGWGWAGSARCLLIPGTCSQGPHAPRAAGTAQRDKGPQLWEFTTSLDPHSHRHPSAGRAPQGAGGAEQGRERAGEAAQHQSPPLPVASCHCSPSPACCPPAPVTAARPSSRQEGTYYGPRTCGARGPRSDPQTTV